jgi:hypothetical protein
MPEKRRIHGKEFVELWDDEARLANCMPIFPLGQLPYAIRDMRQRQAELQAEAERDYPGVTGGTAKPLSPSAFHLGELIDRLEELR